LRPRQIEELSRDLGALTRIRPVDPDLGRWHQRLENDERKLSDLLDRLGILDRAAPSESALVALGKDLDEYMRRVEVDDEAAGRWATKLREAGLAIAERQGERRAILARCAVLAQPGNPGVVILNALASDIELLGVLGSSEAPRLASRLAECRKEISVLQAGLAALDAEGRPAPVEITRLRALFASYAALAAPDDPSEQRWRERLAALAVPGVLPQPEPPPAPAPTPVQVQQPVVPAPVAEVAPAWAADSGRDGAGRWAELRVAGSACRFRLVEAASFSMGAASDPEARPHQVRLTKAFWIAQTECTQSFWRAITGEAAPGSRRGVQQPVTDVSWAEVTTFFTALRHAAPGFAARLPSEAEWEWFARSANSAPSWTKDNANGGPHPVAEAAADGHGCFDVLGNVWEWCADSYGPYPTTAVTDPLPTQGDRRVIRGGGFITPGGTVSATLRSSLGSGARQPFVGFRIAADQP